MGAVFEAIDHEINSDDPNNRLAVKVARSIAGDRGRAAQLFFAEARAAMYLSNSDHFVRVVASDVTPPAYIAMEIVKFPTLTKHLAIAPLAPAQAVNLGIEILEALAKMQEENMVHRDLKPDNIFAQQDNNGEWQIKLADLGLWQKCEERQSSHSLRGTASLTLAQLVGTPPYMSPEQVAQSAITKRSDLHAVGSILWEAMAGSVPYPCTGDMPSILARHEACKTAPSRPDWMLQELYNHLAKALSFDPEQRFVDAREMKAALAGVRDTLLQKCAQDRLGSDLDVLQAELQKVGEACERLASLSSQKDRLSAKVDLIRAEMSSKTLAELILEAGPLKRSVSELSKALRANTATLDTADNAELARLRDAVRTRQQEIDELKTAAVERDRAERNGASRRTKRLIVGIPALLLAGAAVGGLGNAHCAGGDQHLATFEETFEETTSLPTPDANEPIVATVPNTVAADAGTSGTGAETSPVSGTVPPAKGDPGVREKPAAVTSVRCKNEEISEAGRCVANPWLGKWAGAETTIRNVFALTIVPGRDCGTIKYWWELRDAPVVDAFPKVTRSAKLANCRFLARRLLADLEDAAFRGKVELVKKQSASCSIEVRILDPLYQERFHGRMSACISRR